MLPDRLSRPCADVRAGTNCGSCIPELKKLLATTALSAVA